MNIFDIVTVSTVCELNSFTKAANQLNITQSAVSHAISRLEKELGVQLFIRDNKKLQPTSSCEILLTTGREILQLWEKMRADMKEISDRGNSYLRIGMIPSLFMLLSDGSDTFRDKKQQEYIYEIIQDSSNNLEYMLVNGSLDFAFTRAPILNKTLECEPLLTDTLMFAVSRAHPVYEKIKPLSKSFSEEKFPRISLSDLKEFQNEPFSIHNAPRITPLCMQICKEAGFNPIIKTRSNSWENVYHSIQNAYTLGFVTSLYARVNNIKQVQFFLIDSPLTSMKLVVAYHSRSMISPNARLYINMIREHFIEMPPV